ncbi:hypothetical protein N1027_07465 [Herbiconiux sp. CPCC 205763]|uniref:SbsA Ig-like domain-containing protein n=1 Tax=Herbiconiux aconitum TaxID=2970913 RepID=A0ABT2GP12_9MICO|nr:hypothetical protein [Herbiconiux aconitum]MCS5717973.1 hypothetical protein [Herbiconiux aconitum]
MSTDRPATGRRELQHPPPARPRQNARRWREYRRATVATIAVLALGAAGLGFAAVLRGPKLDSASVNLSAVISRDAQKLVLHADQPLVGVNPEQVSITPSAPFDVSSDGSDVTLTFAGMLDYATDYRVRVDGAEGASTGLSGALDYSFETPDPEVYTLLRQGGAAAADRPPDQILRSGVAGGADARSDVVFEAPRIQQFAVAGSALAAVVVGDDGGTALELSVDGGAAADVHTPAGGRIQNLHASPSAHLFGFTVNGGTVEGDASDRVYQNALFVVDPFSTSGRAEEVTGFSGEPLRVVDWEFVPGTSSLVAQGTDQQLYLIDALAGSDAEPTPLGRHAAMLGFLPGGVQLIVGDGETTSTIDLATGAEQPLDRSLPDVDPAYYPKKIVTLAGSLTIGQYDDVDYSEASPVVGSVIVASDAGGSRELYRPPVAGSRVRDFCVSPNGQYLAVETIPSDGVSDGYALPGYSGMTTSLVDIRTGASTRGVPGFLPDWCS